MKKKDGVVYLDNSVKGIYTKHSETVIINTKGKPYESTLQEVNDRILTYRPIVDKYHIKDWDGVTWDYGVYPTFDSGDPNDSVDAKLFKDFKTLVKSAACLRGYNKPYRVRGGTYQDVDDFFNYVTIKICDRRLKQYDWTSPCREIDNWPSYIARVIPNFLILYNKSKIDLEVETAWPMVRDEKTGTWQPKDFGIDFKLPPELITKEAFFRSFNKALRKIPEAMGFSTDILMYILYGISFSNQKLVSNMAKVLKMQMYESEEDLI